MVVKCSTCKRCIRNNFNDELFDCTDKFYPRKNMTFKQIRAWRVCHSYDRRKKEIEK